MRKAKLIVEKAKAEIIEHIRYEVSLIHHAVVREDEGEDAPGVAGDVLGEGRVVEGQLFAGARVGGDAFGEDLGGEGGVEGGGVVGEDGGRAMQ